MNRKTNIFDRKSIVIVFMVLYNEFWGSKVGKSISVQHNIFGESLMKKGEP